MRFGGGPIDEKSNPSALQDEAFAEALPGLVHRLAAQGLELRSHMRPVGAGNDVLVPATTRIACDCDDALIGAEM